MYYFELQLDYVESKYTCRIARIFVLLSTNVKTAVYQGMVKPCGVQISGHIDTLLCL